MGVIPGCGPNIPVEAWGANRLVGAPPIGAPIGFEGCANILGAVLVYTPGVAL